MVVSFCQNATVLVGFKSMSERKVMENLKVGRKEMPCL